MTSQERERHAGVIPLSQTRDPGFVAHAMLQSIFLINIMLDHQLLQTAAALIKLPRTTS